MLFFILTLLCSGFIQLTSSEEIGRQPAFNLFSVPPKNIFLKGIHPHAVFYEPPHPSLRIVNGQPATRGQFCYQAYLQFSDGRQSWACGGSLVTSQLVLTAAHCVQGATSAIVVLGGLDLSQFYEPGRKVIRVPSSSLRFHEKYDSKRIINDIGTIKLPEPVVLNEYICTVALPSCTAGPLASDNKNYTVSGWGKTSDRTRTTKLMFVVVAGEPQDSCVDFYRRVANYDVIASQLCTSGAEKKSTCNGDSGGPLTQPDSAGNNIQRGIVSLGLNTCEYGAPSVFTDVSYFLDWLCPQL